MAPFSYPRRVGFGECDPARIFYAPRAIDWAIEAADAWWERELGASWADLVRRDGLEARVAALECEYLRPVAAGQVVSVGVELAALEQDRLALRAVGEVAPGQASFHARLDLAFAEPGRAAPRTVPLPYRERLAALPLAPRTRIGRAEARPRAAPRACPAPFTRRRRVPYSECGPGGSVHPQKLVEYAVEAAGEWYETCLGISWIEQCFRGRGTPFVNIRCEFLRPTSAGEDLALDVAIHALGRSSIGYGVAGRDPRGEPCFHADLSACHVADEGGAPRPIPFPDAMRERIAAYQAACRGDG